MCIYSHRRYPRDCYKYPRDLLNTPEILSDEKYPTYPGVFLLPLEIPLEKFEKPDLTFKVEFWGRT